VLRLAAATLGLIGWAGLSWQESARRQTGAPMLAAAEEFEPPVPPAAPAAEPSDAEVPERSGDPIGTARTGGAAVDSGDGSEQPFEGGYEPYPMPRELVGVDLMKQTEAEAAAKSEGCLRCHAGAHDPHLQPHKPLTFHLGCTDCHGGDPCATTAAAAHVKARYPEMWAGSGNPVRSYTVLNYERPEFVRFMNPGDLRVAHISCGTSGCHGRPVLEVRKSMMTHGCMLWGAALYNNGSVPFKWPRYGESYSMNGAPQRLQTVPPPTPEETARKGVLPYLDPLPRYQVSQPGNVLRIFERGGRFAPEVGIPERLEEPGRPRTRVSNRGLGTKNRTDPVLIGLTKTRLFDPTLNFLGTNDHPGDYRSSGCTSCHVIYANDRSPIHSGPYAKYGNRGTAAAETDDIVRNVDPTIPAGEPGHPIEHRFTSGIPTSQCMVCHIHPGTTVMNSYLGYMWWDLETDAELMYPEEEKELTAEGVIQASMSDPNEASARGNWSDPEFLNELTQLNPVLRHNTFADFHGHGWVFRAVFKKDRYGNLLDRRGLKLTGVTAADREKAVSAPLAAKEIYQVQTQAKAKELVPDETDAETVRRLEREFEEAWAGVPVHQLDVHIEKGMHCVDCHFIQDAHGNTKLYGEVRAAVEIACEKCHGNAGGRAFELVDGGVQKPLPGERPKIFTSGPAAEERPGPSPDGRELTAMRTPSGKPRFEIRDDGTGRRKVYQNSMVEADLSWEITQVADTIDPTSLDYNPRSALAKTVRFDEAGQFAWGDRGGDPACAHSTTKISCQACHSSWNPTCYGCHLPQKANVKAPDLHNEGDVTRNYVSYDFQTLRDDVFMIAKDGNVTGNRVNPSRSSCAIHVTSYNANREVIYTQQQTISAEGMSGIAFSTNVPHTVRGKGETKACTDCHLSTANDNNAVMAQLFMQGTNFFNFIGRYCWVAGGEHGLFGVIVTEREEPQAVIGSTLHKSVYPERFQEHVDRGGELEHAHEHPGRDIKDEVLRPWFKPEILDVQHRGEYLYAACGEDGARFFDVAFIDHKGFSERIVTAPVSPLGQKFHVPMKHCTSIGVPTTIAPDPTRKHDPANDEADVTAVYGNVYATDLHEGLVVIGVGTLLDGDPLNNFVERAATFNPNGLLRGAKSITLAGNYGYVCCDAGIVVLDLSEPTKPNVCTVLGSDCVDHPKAVEFQFRYAFVADAGGMKVLDVTELAQPKLVAAVPLPDARNLYVARNHCYVAGGRQGLVIVDVTNPEAPAISQVFDAGGSINDLHDVKLGITYTSEFAYLADGCNGLRIVQLTSPESPGYDAFFPTPAPRLIATYPLPKGGHCLAVSEGIDRDRAVDECGQQIAVFGRVGARPLNLEEQRRMYMSPTGAGVYRVIDGVRDYGIADPRRREFELHRELERFYGVSRHPSRRPSGRQAARPAIAR